MGRALLLLLALLAAPAASAETLRVATYDVELSQKGAGQLLALLLKDPAAKPDPKLEGALAAILEARPDVLLLSGFDHDLHGRALEAFAARLRSAGLDYPHRFAEPVNAGEASGLDLDGDTLLMGWGDAHGWGRFPGNGGMAILSRWPLDTAAARSFRTLRWSMLPGADLPRDAAGGLWPSPEAAGARRLSSRSHWDVPVVLGGGGRLHLLAAGPTPPLYDGEERSNKLRNRDELRLWARYLDGVPLTDDAGVTAPAPEAPVVVLGDLAIDPADGAGLRDGIAGLLAHRRLQDPEPESRGAAAAATLGAMPATTARRPSTPPTSTTSRARAISAWIMSCPTPGWPSPGPAWSGPRRDRWRAGLPPALPISWSGWTSPCPDPLCLPGQPLPVLL